MEELYLKTEQGNLSIEEEQAKKYNLKKGEISPYTNFVIVNQFQDGTKEVTDQKASYDREEMHKVGQIFTTAEALDIARGADSDNP